MCQELCLLGTRDTKAKTIKMTFLIQKAHGLTIGLQASTRIIFLKHKSVQIRPPNINLSCSLIERDENVK